MIGKALIITHTEDYTADLVVQQLNRRSLPYTRFNTDSACGAFRFSNASGAEFPEPLRNASSIWYRRIKNPVLNFEDTYQEDYFNQEYKEYLHNIISIFNGNWLNHPLSIAAAESKMLQLQKAIDCGLRIPDTLVTADTSQIAEFSRMHSEIIIKPLYNNAYSHRDGTKPIYTSEISADRASELFENRKDYSPLPAILQQRIHKKLEYRITVVKGAIFSAALSPFKNGGEVLDWRKERPPFFLKEIPGSVQDKLFELMNALELKFGAIDLIEDDAGNFFFLEINPNGQWAWLEMDLGMPISEAIISFLYE